jgi:hypothetical protein
MPLLVTSASGASGNGFGALLAFESDGRLCGTFINDGRIADPRGLAVDSKEDLLSGCVHGSRTESNRGITTLQYLAFTSVQNLTFPVLLVSADHP